MEATAPTYRLYGRKRREPRRWHCERKDEKRGPNPRAAAGAVEDRRARASNKVSRREGAGADGPLPSEALAEALDDGKGELWGFGNMALTEYGVGRAEYVMASGKAWACRSPIRSRPRSAPSSPTRRRAYRRRFDFIPVAEAGGQITVWAPTVPKPSATAVSSVR